MIIQIGITIPVSLIIEQSTMMTKANTIVIPIVTPLANLSNDVL